MCLPSLVWYVTLEWVRRVMHSNVFTFSGLVYIITSINVTLEWIRRVMNSNVFPM